LEKLSARNKGPSRKVGIVMSSSAPKMRVVATIDGGTLGIDPTQLRLAQDDPEAVPPVELDKYPMTQILYLAWKNSDMRFHLVFEMVVAFAKALGRQLDTADVIDQLVGYDGEEVTCAVTGKKFRPIWWIIPFQGLLEAIRQHGDIRKAVEELDGRRGIIRFGHVLLFDGWSGDRTFVSGSPYFVANWGYAPDNKSVLVKAAKKNAERLGREGLMWPISVKQVENQLRWMQEDEDKKLSDRRRQLDKERREQAVAEDNLDKLFLRGGGG